MAVDSSEIPAYKGNCLIDACGPILTREELAAELTYLPPSIKKSVTSLPHEIRAHCLQDVLALNIPTQAALDIAQSLHLVLRRGYIQRDPRTPEARREAYGDPNWKPTTERASLVMTAVDDREMAQPRKSPP